jgi:hypothetical protein
MNDAASRDITHALDAYARYWEALTPDSLAGLADHVAPDVRFRDPFNDVRGIDGLRAVLAHMFATTADSRFVVTDRAVGQAAAYMRWRYTFRPKGRPKGARGAPWEIVGMTEITFDAAGRVASHIDHWDAAGQLYERVPVLGALLRLVRRRMAAG